ncbi:hypothetical protein [Henriciella sp.]|uniref:hypothetical protein n=1 Tax=Henriciella sp. TaxID=1968823 RepID=UPI002616CFFD|nr:hypothetical protein [Henriciella sp.]
MSVLKLHGIAIDVVVSESERWRVGKSRVKRSSIRAGENARMCCVSFRDAAVL